MKARAFLPTLVWTATVFGFAIGPVWCAEEPVSPAPPKLSEPALTDLITNALNAASAPATSALTTNAPIEIRFPPQLMDQIRREIEQSSIRNAEAIKASLSLLEPALSRMQQRQAEALHGANNTVLIIACIFAGVSFMMLVVIALILARALGRFSELVVAGPPARRELNNGPAPAALEAGGPTAPDRAVEQASHRFQGALEQLQRRIHELEHGLQGASGDGARNQIVSGTRTQSAPSNGVTSGGAMPFLEPMPQPDEQPAPATNESGELASRAAVLLGKGQTLLNLGDGKEALACIQQALALTPNNAEAQVKKGLALEQLENWTEALESYDRALALDSSLTVAYLYKGAVCNRLERYQEALASYEQALRAEGKSRAS